MTVSEVTQKLERYCAYQERCHAEVRQKLREFPLSASEKDSIIVRLIETGYLNEERFASVFSQGKFHQKKWGKIRLKNELQSRQISGYLIAKALGEISNEAYESLFDELADKHWESLTEKDVLKKRKKFCDYLLRKGWESDRVYQKVKELERN